MPMTNAERQRKYREKLKENPEKHTKIKEQTRERMKKRKPVSEIPEEEKEKRRKQWQIANEKRRKKRNAEKQIINNADVASSTSNCTAKSDIKNIKDKKVEDLEEKVIRQKNVIENITKKNKNLKKQVYRQKLKIKDLTESVENDLSEEAPNADLTPLTKTNKFIEENLPEVNEKEKERVKRKVLQLNVLSNSLQEEYNTAKNNAKKDILKKVTTNEIVRKYKLKTNLSKCLGLKGQVRQKIGIKRTSKEAEKIEKFFKRDDNSRNTAGKKEYILDKKKKIQKRFLLNSMKKLHEKYRTEGGKFSLTSFCRYRPRYIVRPKINDRDTCACIKHCNLTFKALKLKNLGVISTSDLGDLVASVACSTKNYDCMYGKCQKCKDKSPEFNDNTDNEIRCNWLHWLRKEHVYNKRTTDGTIKSGKTKRYVKEVASGTVLELKQLFLKELLDFKKHYFNIIHQHTQYRECVDNLKDDEIAIMIDFSENYQCKHAVEIQSFHFGASQQQITLHTGVLYTKDNKPKSFASLSACNDHDPGAIRAHLEPVVQYIKQEQPNAKIIHFFSDGPTTQYRQKKNFHLINQLIIQHGFKFATWSFSEAAHGKGAADGVGGTLKRTLDQQVAFGKDVSNLVEALDTLRQNTNIKLFHVTEAEIRTRQNEVPDDLIAVPKTMNVHQIIFRDGDLYFREISCFCGMSRGLCTCFNIRKHDLRRVRLPPEQIDLTSTNDIEPSKNTTTELKDKASKIKNKKTTKKRQISSDVSSTTTENSDVPYAESDESPYNPNMETVDDDNFEDWCQTKENSKRPKIDVTSDILLNHDQLQNTERKKSDNVAWLLKEKKLTKISIPDRIIIKTSEKPDRTNSSNKSPKADTIIPTKPDAADQIKVDDNNLRAKIILDNPSSKINDRKILVQPNSKTKTLRKIRKPDMKTTLKNSQEMTPPKMDNKKDSKEASQSQCTATSDIHCGIGFDEHHLSNEKKDFDVNSWVLIRFTDKYYVAQILNDCEFGTYKVLPVRKISTNKFCHVDLYELDKVSESHIVCSLSEPQYDMYDKSGQYIFNNLPNVNFL